MRARAKLLSLTALLLVAQGAAAIDESTWTSPPARAQLQRDPTLISGVRINIGAHVLHANLADELAFFQRSLNHDS